MTDCNTFWGTSHNWSKWKIKEERPITRVDNKAKIGYWLLQERICKNCNFKQIRSQKENL